MALACFSNQVKAQNNALNFDGTNDYVSVSNSLPSTNTITIETWINPTDLSGAGTFRGILMQNSWSAGIVHFLFIGNQLQLSINPLSDQILNSFTFNTNTWYHVAVTYSSSTQTMQWYVNGVLQETDTSVGASTITTAPFFIGAWNNAGTPQRFFAGTMDELRVWNTVRTQAQISANMNNELVGDESGLVAYYKFNQGTAGGTNTGLTTLNDNQTNGTAINGTLNNFALAGSTSNWVGSRTNALNFDGTNDNVRIPHNSTLNSANNLTLEAWVYRTSNGHHTVIAKWDDEGNNRGYMLNFGELGNPDNICFLATSTGQWSPNPYLQWDSGISINLNQWYHIAITFQNTGSNNVKLYVNGSLSAQTTWNFSIYANTMDVFVGGYDSFNNGQNAGANDRFFDGSIDEVRIWNTTRTCSEIQSTMNRELLGNESGLVAYYNFNQGTAGANNAGITTLTDLATVVGGANNGTLTNFALTGATSNWVDGSGNGVSGTTPQTPAEINVTVGSSGNTVNVGGYATGTPVDFTYTIQNTGSTSLSLTNSPIVEVTSGSGFTVQTQPSSSSIAGGNSLTFVIRFNPAVLGTTYTTTFQILNSDCDESTYTFTLTGKAVSATPSSVRGDMMSFDGTDDYLTASHNTNLNTLPLTVELWTKGANPTGTAPMVSKYANSSFNGWALNMTTGGLVQGFYFNSGANFSYDVRSNSAITDGNWHHVAYILDNTGSYLYIDGVLNQSTGWTGTPTAATTTQALQFGQMTGYSGIYNGQMEEVRIWNVALTQSQIRENMHLTLSGGESGLVGYWQFNEESGDAIDVVNGNNGTLQGGVSRVESTVSVAKGISSLQTVNSTGLKTFDNLSINFTSMSAPVANDEFAVYQLQDTPLNNVDDANVKTTTSQYWIVRQFGTQTFTYDGMTFVIPSSNVIDSDEETGQPGLTNLKLFKRATNSAGTWGTEIGVANAASNSTKTIEYTISPAQNSFSEFIPASIGTSPLPITLLQFNATRINAEEVQLAWATATETNNIGFEVEQSEDGLTFMKVGFVDGKGNSTSLNTYHLSLNNPSAAYYRLKQVDLDGKFSYSPIRFVEGIAPSLYFAPNPMTNELHLIGETKDNVRMQVEVLSADGKVIWQGTGNRKEIENSLNLALQHFKAGLYIFRLQSNGKMNLQKLVKY